MKQFLWIIQGLSFWTVIGEVIRHMHKVFMQFNHVKHGQLGNCYLCKWIICCRALIGACLPVHWPIEAYPFTSLSFSIPVLFDTTLVKTTKTHNSCSMLNFCFIKLITELHVFKWLLELHLLHGVLVLFWSRWCVFCMLVLKWTKQNARMY